MKKLFLKWILLAIAVVAASFLTQYLGLGFHADVSSGQKALQLLVGVAILAVLNGTLGKILKLLTLPLNCLTLGLFSLVINALMLWLAAQSGFGMKITGDAMQQIGSAFIGALLISIINGLLNSFLGDDKDKDDDD